LREQISLSGGVLDSQQVLVAESERLERQSCAGAVGDPAAPPCVE
jgi:hypothetical protein